MTRWPSLAEQAAEAIVNGIASGALKPGQRLPETELAASLRMSRVPLREALKILEAQGIVESVPHRGTQIQAFDDRRIDQICEARVARKLVGELDAIVARMEQAAQRLEWMEISRADLIFHREVCRASGNKIVLTLWEALARHVLIIFGQEIRDEKDAAVLGPQHRRLRDLLFKGEAAKLDREIENHILRLRRKRRDQRLLKS